MSFLVVSNLNLKKYQVRSCFSISFACDDPLNSFSDVKESSYSDGITTQTNTASHKRATHTLSSRYQKTYLTTMSKNPKSKASNRIIENISKAVSRLDGSKQILKQVKEKTGGLFGCADDIPSILCGLFVCVYLFVF